MKSLFKNPIVIVLTLYLITLLVWDATLFFNPVKTTQWNYWFNVGYGLVYLGGGIVGVIYAFRTGISSVFGKALAFIGVGLVSYSAGQLAWFFYNAIAHIDVPYPSGADMFFVLFYPLVFVGLILLLSVFKRFVTRNMMIQSVLLASLTFILTPTFLFKPDLSSDLPLFERMFNAFYVAGDTVLLAVILITLRLAGGYFRSITLFFALAGVFMLIGDFLFSYRSANGTYWNGDIADLVYMLTGYVFFLSFVYFMQKMGSQQSEESEKASAVPN